MFHRPFHSSQFSLNKMTASLLILLALSISIQSQTNPTYAEKLGWGPKDVVVILHVDDVGMSHSSNTGAIQAVEHGLATSWAVMMPCAWVSEIAHYLSENPSIDSGLHLTLTSEWKSYRWGPLAGKSVVPGLVDNEGCLWRSVPQVLARASADEIELEIRAQVDRAETMGMPITHMDSHMGTLFAHPEYFKRYVKIGIEKQIPILAPGGHLTYATKENGASVQALKPFIDQVWSAGLPVIDDLHTDSYGWPADSKPERLSQLLKSLKPGITEILFHASEPTDVFPLITGSSESRKGDLEALTSDLVRNTIKEENIILTTWKELMDRRREVQP
ncbi:polysaccharide deacetylase family protein [bacterium]|nr:polysaccharide deacetylase family protein [bacterium]